MSLASVGRKLLLSALSLVVALAAAELLARWAEPGPMSLYDRQPYDRDPVLRQRHRPGFEGRWDGTWYAINERGFRGGPCEPTFGPEELRIVALGDSCTFGKGVREEDTWPRRLEALLRAELGGEVTPVVANLGVNGYSTSQYLAVLEEQALPLRPHVVVLAYNVNDFPNLVRSVDLQVFQGEQGLWRRFRTGVHWRWRARLDRLALYRWMRATWYELHRDENLRASERRARSVQASTTPDLLRLQEESRRLAELARRARESGAHVLLFLFPYESMVYLDAFEHGPEAFVRETARDLDVAYADVAAALREHVRAKDPPPRLYLRGDRYHLGPEGYGVVARSVLDELKRRGWLDPRR